MRVSCCRYRESQAADAGIASLGLLGVAAVDHERIATIEKHFGIDKKKNCGLNRGVGTDLSYPAPLQKSGSLDLMTTGGVLHFLSNDGSRSDANQSCNHVYREVTDACVPARNKELSNLKSRAQRKCRDAQQQLASAITKCKRQSVQQKNCGMLDVVRNVRDRPQTWRDYC
jgi:hypothetical protein